MGKLNRRVPLFLLVLLVEGVIIVLHGRTGRIHEVVAWAVSWERESSGISLVGPFLRSEVEVER